MNLVMENIRKSKQTVDERELYRQYNGKRGRVSRKLDEY